MISFYSQWCLNRNFKYNSSMKSSVTIKIKELLLGTIWFGIYIHRPISFQTDSFSFDNLLLRHFYHSWKFCKRNCDNIFEHTNSNAVHEYKIMKIMIYEYVFCCYLDSKNMGYYSCNTTRVCIAKWDHKTLALCGSMRVHLSCQHRSHA